MQRSIGPLYPILVGLIAFTVFAAPVAAEEFAALHFGPEGFWRVEETERDPHLLIVDGGFLHGFAPGMKVHVYTAPRGGESPQEVGVFEVAHVLAYETTGLLEPKEDNFTADSLIRACNHSLSIAIPDRTPKDLKRTAEKGAKDGQWKLARHYWSAYLAFHPDDEQAVKQVEQCTAAIEADQVRPLADHEKLAAELAREQKYEWIQRYLARGKFDHARDKVREIQRVFPDDYMAGILADRIERLAALDPDSVYRMEDDPQGQEADIVPAWPLPGQPDVSTLRATFSGMNSPMRVRVLVDREGVPLQVEPVSTAGPREGVQTLLRTVFTPCLRNGEPVTSWTTLTFGGGNEELEGIEIPGTTRLVYEDPDSCKILYARLLEPDTIIQLLLVVDGGYHDGLHSGLKGHIVFNISEKLDLVTADVTLMDVDRYQAWCKATLRPGIDPRLLERACSVGQLVIFDAGAAIPDSLTQAAVAAMGSADYETAAALLTRLTSKHGDNPSATSALNRSLARLDEAEQQPLSEEELAFEQRYLDLYCRLMKKYFAERRFAPALDRARQVLRIEPEHALARSYAEVLSASDSSGIVDINSIASRLILTSKRSSFPQSFDASVPQGLPLSEIGGVSRVLFDINRNGHAVVTLLRSCGNSRLDDLALRRVKETLWQDYAYRTCAVDYRTASSGTVMIYGTRMDESEKPEPVVNLSNSWSGGVTSIVVTEEAVVLRAPETELP